MTSEGRTLHLGVRQRDGSNRCLTCGGVFIGWGSPYCPGLIAPARVES